MTMPKLFTDTFIGNLIKMAANYPRNSPVWCRLWTAVKQCRNYNDGDQAARDLVWPYMLRTRAELRELGVMVG